MMVRATVTYAGEPSRSSYAGESNWVANRGEEPRVRRRARQLTRGDGREGRRVAPAPGLRFDEHFDGDARHV